ncbi:MAG TPA: TMEM14 family protein [Byssovorax sp.]|jgi:uncharacterized membrane protein (UPF0136 family)
MFEIARGFLFVFGVASIAGGVVGFVKAQSKASLIAGGASGALLIGAGVLASMGQPRTGLALGLAVSLGLAGRFIPQFLKTQKVMPAGVMAGLSAVGILTTALALLGK